MTTTTISPARHRSLGDHTWQDQAVCQSTEYNPVDPDMFFPEPDETGKVRIDYRPVHLQPLSNDVQSFPPKARVY